MKLLQCGKERLPVPVIPSPLHGERIKNVTKALSLVPQKGEYLMKCWLDLLVASDEYVDNARPGFLLNPLSGEPLEFDRYYLIGVGFEFNGPQHYGPTALFPDGEVFKDVRTRDLLKKGLSQEKGVVLVTVTAKDLGLDEMHAKIPDQLPRCFVDRDSPYVKALERMSAEYRAKAGA